MPQKKTDFQKREEKRLSKNFKRYIKAHRKNAELSQRELSQRAGLAASYAGNLESRLAHWMYPTEESLRGLAKVLSVNADEMMGMGGRISTDVQDIIYEHPIEICAFLRACKDLSVPEWEFLTEQRKADIEYNEEWDKQAELCSECGK